MRSNTDHGGIWTPPPPAIYRPPIGTVRDPRIANTGDPGISTAITWTHEEPEADAVFPSAIENARLGTLIQLPAPAAARQVRAFLIYSLAIAKAAAGPGSLAWTRPMGELDSSLFPDAERNAIGALIARTPMLILPPGEQRAIVASFRTQGAGPALTGQGEAGFPPLAIVAIACAAAAAVAYLGGKITELVDSVNFRNAQTSRILSAQATAAKVVEAHASREKQAGTAQPYTDEERRLLQQLGDEQQRAADQQRRPLPSPFGGAQEFFTAATGTLTAALPFAILAGLILLSSQQRAAETAHTGG